jgi:hypothetical protein
MVGTARNVGEKKRILFFVATRGSAYEMKYLVESEIIQGGKRSTNVPIIHTYSYLRTGAKSGFRAY